MAVLEEIGNEQNSPNRFSGIYNYGLTNDLDPSVDVGYFMIFSHQGNRRFHNHSLPRSQ